MPWETYVSKSQELASEKKDPALQVDSAGALRLTKKEAGPTANLQSDLLVRFALQRRGLALDQCRLVEWTIHERWVAKLFEHRVRPVPGGYSEVSLSQLRDAAAHLFEVMAQACRGGVQVRPDGSRPLYQAM